MTHKTERETGIWENTTLKRLVIETEWSQEDKKRKNRPQAIKTYFFDPAASVYLMSM